VELLAKSARNWNCTELNSFATPAAINVALVSTDKATQRAK